MGKNDRRNPHPHRVGGGGRGGPPPAPSGRGVSSARDPTGPSAPLPRSTPGDSGPRNRPRPRTPRETPGCRSTRPARPTPSPRAAGGRTLPPGMGTRTPPPRRRAPPTPRARLQGGEPPENEKERTTQPIEVLVCDPQADVQEVLPRHRRSRGRRPFPGEERILHPGVNHRHPLRGDPEGTGDLHPRRLRDRYHRLRPPHGSPEEEAKPLPFPPRKGQQRQEPG